MFASQLSEGGAVEEAIADVLGKYFERDRGNEEVLYTFNHCISDRRVGDLSGDRG